MPTDCRETSSTRSTRGSSRHSSSTPLPTMPVAPKMTTFTAAGYAPRPVVLLLSLRLPVDRPLSGQDVPLAVVALVAGVLIQLTVRPAQRDRRRPWLRPRFRVGHGVVVFERVAVETGEPFDELHLVAGASPGAVGIEVGRLDHEGIAFPVSAGVARPQTDVRFEARTPVERHHADRVDHLGHQADVVLRL